jgi:hypothetical protein
MKIYYRGQHEVRLHGEANREKIKYVCTSSWKFDVRDDKPVLLTNICPATQEILHFCGSGRLSAVFARICHWSVSPSLPPSHHVTVCPSLHIKV